MSVVGFLLELAGSGAIIEQSEDGLDVVGDALEGEQQRRMDDSALAIGRVLSHCAVSDSRELTQWLESERVAVQLEYWQNQLTELPILTEFRKRKPAQPGAEQRLCRKTYSVPVDTVHAMKALAEDYDVTPLMIVHSALALLLYTHCNCRDIVIGGLFDSAETNALSVLPLRTRAQSTLPYSQFLSYVREVHHGAEAHRVLPFELLADMLNDSGNTEFHPLFQVMLSVSDRQQSAKASDFIRSFMTGLKAPQRSGPELSLACTLDSQELTLEWHFDENLLDAGRIDTLNRHFIRLLQGITEQPGSPVSHLPMMSEQEINHLLNELNDTATPWDSTRTLHQLFAEQAERTPENIALYGAEQTVSYKMLNEDSSRLAHYLVSQGVAANTLVGIGMTRDVDMIVAVLAVLKAGAGYVALDPDYPQARIEYMIGDSKIGFLLTESDLATRFESPHHVNIAIDKIRAELAGYPATMPPCGEVDVGSMAYLLYTSGSTGLPKGVMIEHRNVVAFLAWCHRYFDSESLKCVLASTSLNFDLSVFEMFAPLTMGGACFVVPNILSLIEPRPEYRQLTMINTVPSGLAALLEHNALPESVATVNSAGEPLKRDLVNRLLALDGVVRVNNLYGPTEDTIYSTVETIKTPLQHDPLIGRPIDNSQAYVIGELGQLLPKGVAGELYLGGSNLSRGYLNQPQMTAEKFLTKVLSCRPDERLYRTGDLVRYTETGELEYLGRNDTQVKIRGFRIELGEIDRQLNALDEVRTALVQVRQNNAEHYLVAYVEFDDAVESAMSTEQQVEVGERLKKALSIKLPKHMLPSLFVFIDNWPLTPNGKIDRKALPEPVWQFLAGEYVAPQSPLQQALVDICGEILFIGGERLSIEADFMALGLNSLLAMRLLAQIRSRLGIELSVGAVFAHPCVLQLSEYIGRLKAQTVRSRVVARAKNERIELSNGQKRMWYLDQLQQGVANYNMPQVYGVEGAFNVELAEKALDLMVQRHQVLRTVYRVDEQGEVYGHLIDGHLSLSVEDLSFVEPAKRNDEVLRLVDLEAAKAFNLTEDIMLRANWWAVDTTPGCERGVLMLNMHHIASDGWSLEVMAAEFAQAYDALLKGVSPALTPLDIQYADFALWQNDFTGTAEYQKELEYWTRQLEDMPVLHTLPLDNPRPAKPEFEGAMWCHKLDAEVARQVNKVSRELNVTPFMLLQGLFSQFLYRQSNHPDIVVGTPVNNRTQTEIEPLIGFFVNMLVLRNRCDGHHHFAEFIEHVKQVNLVALDNQDIPVEQLVDSLNIPRSTQYNPLFQITFSLDSNRQPPLTLEGVNTSVMSSEVTSAKFDLALDCAIEDDGLSLNWMYDTGLFDAARIETYNRHFSRMLGQVLSDPYMPLSQLSMLDEAEIQRQVCELNTTVSDYPKDRLVHQLFEQAAQQFGDNVALYFEQQQVSYRQLNQSANRLAHYLKANGVAESSPVALCVNRSIDMVVGILAILKAGGAYVPIDHQYPEARIRYMLEDTGAKHLLTQQGLLDGVAIDKSVLLSELDSQSHLEAMQRFGDDNPVDENPADSRRLALIIYTSGSTGKPKGVMLSHLGIVRLAVDTNHVSHTPTTRAMMCASISFDAATYELWGPLLNGSALVLYPYPHLDINLLNDLINQHRVNNLFMTTGLFEQWSESELALPSLQWVGTGGQVLNPDALRKALDKLPGATITNFYGPTENTTLASFYPVTAKSTLQGAVPIGKTVTGTRLYVLSAESTLVPWGCVGELCVGGDGLALGYLNQPELTAKAFVDNPFAEGRLYRTGDLVRLLPSGDLEFVGRRDHQVKIRGFRIEVGEIELQLQECADVASCLVMVREDVPGQKYLAAYLILDNHHEPDKRLDDIKRVMSQQLPGYMLPSAYVIVQQWPLTQSGKTDLKALPVPNMLDMVQQAYIEPETDTERKLVDIWAGLLKLSVTELGVGVGFFAVGGHSLLATKMVTEIVEQWSVKLTLGEVIDGDTIRNLAKLIDDRIASGDLSRHGYVIEKTCEDNSEDMDEFIL